MCKIRNTAVDIHKNDFVVASEGITISVAFIHTMRSKKNIAEHQLITKFRFSK